MSRRFRSPLQPPERLRYTASNEAPPAQGETIVLPDGRQLLMRPIHPADVKALQRGFSHLSHEEVRLRFLHVMSELPEEMAARLCQLDDEHEIAFVLVSPDENGENEIHAVVRAFIDTVTTSAEFALIVQKAYTGHGLGLHLMQHLIEACRARGVTELWGDVLAENHAMLQMCEALGFERHSAFHDAGVMRVTRAL